MIIFAHSDTLDIQKFCGPENQNNDLEGVKIYGETNTLGDNYLWNH